jgi:hypothetical protein
MGHSVHRIRAFEARRINHPVFTDIEKHWLTVPADSFPTSIGWAANARDPVGLKREVYKDVRASLEGRGAMPGTFDLMNKGITILAEAVRLIDKEKHIFEVVIDDEIGGIVDGAHTAKIIAEAQAAGKIPPEQHVEVYIRTGIKGGFSAEIARALNTGIQVAAKSIYNISNVFDWLKDEVVGEPYASMISWKESDLDPEYDVRDLIGVLEVFNVIDYPNDQNRHPISAYEKWSIPLDKFAADYEKNKNDLSRSTYHRLRPILKGGLALFDQIRRDFYDVRNESGGKAGAMNIVEQASAKAKAFKFPFGDLPDHEYRLTKGATYPMLAAFRNYVELDPKTGQAHWRNGIGNVLKAWSELSPELVQETYTTTQEGSRNPDALGKNRKHWGEMHLRVKNKLQGQVVKELQAQLAERQHPAKRKVTS